ncbi:CHS3 [Symbiodinium sp. KB8]|nr:CHS3 [Symbiodinium sp. KB8]
MESVTGFITVLPGAFSMYRWLAIRGEPLSQYFYREEHSPRVLGPFRCNQYLAEDRVLCFEVVAKPHRRWTLTFVKKAIAATDIPQNLTELIKQRRRWLNGAFFSLLYYLLNFPRFFRASHSTYRLTILIAQFLYNSMNLILSWSMMGSMMLAFLLVFKSALDALGEDVSTVLQFVFMFSYAFLIFTQLLLGLMVKVHEARVLYFTTALIYGIIMVTGLVLSTWLLVRQVEVAGEVEFWVILGALIGAGAYFLAALFHNELLTVLRSFIPFIVLLPTFVNIFPIFSMCNLSDISWGTKEGNTNEEIQRLMEEHKAQEAQLSALKGEATEPSKDQSQGGTEDKGDGGDKGAAAPAEVDQLSQRLAKYHDKVVKELEAKKARDEEDRREMEREFNAFRLRVVALWIGSNTIYVCAVLTWEVMSTWAMTLAIYMVVITALKLLGSLWYQLERCTRVLFRSCCPCCYRKLPNNKKVCWCRGKHYDIDNWEERSLVWAMRAAARSNRVAREEAKEAEEQSKRASSRMRGPRGSLDSDIPIAGPSHKHGQEEELLDKVDQVFNSYPASHAASTYDGGFEPDADMLKVNNIGPCDSSMNHTLQRVTPVMVACLLQHSAMLTSAPDGLSPDPHYTRDLDQQQAAYDRNWERQAYEKGLERHAYSSHVVWDHHLSGGPAGPGPGPADRLRHADGSSSVGRGSPTRSGGKGSAASVASGYSDRGSVDSAVSYNRQRGGGAHDGDEQRFRAIEERRPGGAGGGAQAGPTGPSGLQVAQQPSPPSNPRRVDSFNTATRSRRVAGEETTTTTVTATTTAAAGGQPGSSGNRPRSSGDFTLDALLAEGQAVTDAVAGMASTDDADAYYDDDVNSSDAEDPASPVGSPSSRRERFNNVSDSDDSSAGEVEVVEGRRGGGASGGSYDQSPSGWGRR